MSKLYRPPSSLFAAWSRPVLSLYNRARNCSIQSSAAPATTLRSLLIPITTTTFFTHNLISTMPFNRSPSRVRAFTSEPGDFDTSNSLVVRKHLRTYGRTPPNVESYETQAYRCLKQLDSKGLPIEKYLYLSQLRNTNVHLFYRLAVDHMKEMTPLIYTPVVGEACLKWSEIYTQPEGMYISYEDRGNIASVLRNWHQPNVEITVVTDGSRILGLGDLGINGMGIPVGKLALYSACGGIRPEATLPLTLDLGTNNKALLEDPLYMGSRRTKVTAQEEKEFLDELMEALTNQWPE